MKGALVTGATGFIGSHLVRRLAAEGWNVHVVTRPFSDLRPLHDLGVCFVPHTHDGTAGSLCDILASAHPSIVFHLASLFIAQHKTDDVGPLIQSNVQFAAQLLEAMVTSGVYRLVNTGTAWQHYQNGGYNPVNLYAATKQAYEAILTFYVETTPLRAITLKLFDTYGPDDPRPKLFTLLRRVAKEGQPLAMSPGEQLIDLVYIDDVVSAFTVAGNRLLAGVAQGHENYAVSSGNPLPLKEIVKLYGRATGKELPIDWGERPYRPREVMVPWNRGITLPGWKATVDLEQGIRSMEHRSQ